MLGLCRIVNRTLRIIKSNIDLLVFYNKNNLWGDWDYEQAYKLFIWKLHRIGKQIEENNITVDCKEVCEQISKLEDIWDDYVNVYDKVDETLPDKEYVDAVRNLEETAWKEFHKHLRKHARGWWD